MDDAKGDAKLSPVEHATREDAHVGQILGTAKLVATFSAAFAAIFVATASVKARTRIAVCARGQRSSSGRNQCSHAYPRQIRRATMTPT
jgi:hypothetical protein